MVVHQCDNMNLTLPTACIFSPCAQALQAAGGLDAILDTVSAKHDLSFYVNLLKVNGKYVIVGAPPEPYALSAFQLIFGRKLVAGSLIGGIKETQEMLDFCAEKNVLPMIEKINIDYVNTAMERMLKVRVVLCYPRGLRKSFWLDLPQNTSMC